MGETFRSLVTDGPLLVAAGVAALVGLISFASPCVLPLVPGYLAYVSGLVGTGADARPPSGGRRDGDRGAHRRLPARPHGARRGAVRARLHRRVRRLRRGVRRPGPADARVRRRAQPGVRRRHDPRRARRSWAGCRCCSAPSGSPRARPPGWPGRRCSGVVFGLGWTPCLGPTLVGGLLAGVHRGDRRRAARCWASRTASASACRSCSSRSARAGRMGATGVPAPARPHA